MKRKPLSSYDDISRIWTFFEWNLCDSCRLEFRRETGFKYIKCTVRSSNRNYINVIHLCSNCAPDLHTAYIYFVVEKRWINRKGMRFYEISSNAKHALV